MDSPTLAAASEIRIQKALSTSSMDSSQHSDAEGKASSPEPSSSKKRAVSPDPSGAAKATKRRAARACVSCRARKVRCDVVEGAPCGNCRWDNVECVVQESRRRKKNIFDSKASGSANGTAPQSAEVQQQQPPLKAKAPVNSSVSITPLRRASTVSQISSNNAQTIGSSHNDAGLPAGADTRLPQALHQQSAMPLDPVMLARLQAAGNQGTKYPSIWPNLRTASQASIPALSSESRAAQFGSRFETSNHSPFLAPFIRPLPSKIVPEDVAYLQTKGALTLPAAPLQNALLQAYIEYVHPYMPLLEIRDFLSVINSSDGMSGQTSLLLYQAVMFAATAYVDVKWLHGAGYPSRKAARKSYFNKTRLLYDFDYESDRLILVQSLLLMTYWYETPDDQKDTWHWMGVAISLAHTIGLHRNPARTSMPVHKQKLWKRIWWSCFMRDRLVALGMRRPTRIKDEDFDVPMLEVSDFEIATLPDEIEIIGPECCMVRDTAIQQELALMCIAKAKLCLCVSHMLRAQYSVLIRDTTKPENTTNSTMMLFPNKQLNSFEKVNACDAELMAWQQSLPACCQYQPLTPADLQNGRATIAVQRNLLHMVFYTTISALHRPQFLPSSPHQVPQVSIQMQDFSRMRVRDAAMHITRMVAELHSLRLEKFLPTTGVTVILPALIIHLLDMKSPVPQARDAATRGFRKCMRVMEKLRDIYAAADYAVAFLDAALRKAQVETMALARANQGVATHNIADLKTLRPQFTVPPPTAMDDVTTPPPESQQAFVVENSSHVQDFASPVMLQQHQQQQFVPPADLMAPAHEGVSPPHSDKDMLTPSASGSSDENEAPLDIDMDFDAMDNQDEFDWNALTGTNIDFDQWLHYPQADGKDAMAVGTMSMADADGPTSFLGMLDAPETTA
ncbi:fungal-specific transcription factor domain-containing protein [Microdochium trichocladiopsis]|uniref:Fungal-specific transcription factor domain-containing protein n=1 Tax=Microdochium trichocladiopsis TaxID=1682393 RepID=A0A9P9BRP6_9PEZI|nr:fungal-specific transcription factor domain-containing protein [Microdochium trichocladiopsis]KAH7032953.1 fungal-specific transcription factor domain-containing protein [Microdochium trichocladiopsis]